MQHNNERLKKIYPGIKCEKASKMKHAMDNITVVLTLLAKIQFFIPLILV